MFVGGRISGKPSMDRNHINHRVDSLEDQAEVAP